MSRRTERVAEQIQSEVARVLRTEATDPRIGLVTITRVDVAPDLSHALIFWSALASDDPDALARVEAGLDSAAPFLRRRLAEALPLRRMPELRFRFDPSLALGSQTLRVLRELEDDEPA
jgi:ribosome-binding factor A